MPLVQYVLWGPNAFFTTQHGNNKEKQIVVETHKILCLVLLGFFKQF